jgi:hypothetical protein
VHFLQNHIISLFSGFEHSQNSVATFQLLGKIIKFSTIMERIAYSYCTVLLKRPRIEICVITEDIFHEVSRHMSLFSALYCSCFIVPWECIKNWNSERTNWGFISQTTTFFIVTAVKTWNLTWKYYFEKFLEIISETTMELKFYCPWILKLNCLIIMHIIIAILDISHNPILYLGHEVSEAM